MGVSVIVLAGGLRHCGRAMKHRIYTKLNRQFGKPLSKTTKSAVRKAVGKAKPQPAAKKAPGRPAKKSTWKAAAKAPKKDAELAPAVREVRAEPSLPHNPLRPHRRHQWRQRHLPMEGPCQRWRSARGDC